MIHIDITSLSVAIAIDGNQSLPKTPDGDYDIDPTKQPIQIPLTRDELKQAENIVKKSIDFNEARGDQVAVENIMFDRTKQWQEIREEFIKKERLRKTLLGALIGAFALDFRHYTLQIRIQRTGKKTEDERGATRA